MPVFPDHSVLLQTTIVQNIGTFVYWDVGWAGGILIASLLRRTMDAKTNAPWSQESSRPQLVICY